MSFTFLAQIPNTPDTESPTVWRDDATGDLIVQGYKGTEEDYLQADAAGSTGNHRHGPDTIPAHEAIVRVPASIIPALREALSA